VTLKLSAIHLLIAYGVAYFFDRISDSSGWDPTGQEGSGVLEGEMIGGGRRKWHPREP
jgi:hypothetical protein